MDTGLGCCTNTVIHCLLLVLSTLGLTFEQTREIVESWPLLLTVSAKCFYH